MKSTLLLAVASFCLMTISTAQAASTVYRCGPDGRIYSDTPCAAGRTVDVADPRSAEEHRAGHDAAQRERALAADLKRERQAREADGARLAAAGPIRIGSPPSVETAPTAKKTKAAPAPHKRQQRQRVNPTPKKADQSTLPSQSATGTSPSALRATRHTPG